jgi:hypothetical protein
MLDGREVSERPADKMSAMEKGGTSEYFAVSNTSFMREAAQRTARK